MEATGALIETMGNLYRLRRRLELSLLLLPYAERQGQGGEQIRRSLRDVNLAVEMLQEATGQSIVPHSAWIR